VFDLDILALLLILPVGVGNPGEESMEAVGAGGILLDTNLGLDVSWF
jgi:hypothetical protein